MDRTKSDLSYEKREMNKMSLDSYALDKHNVLDHPIDKIIDNLGQKLKNNWKEHGEWRKMEQENPEKYSNLGEIAQQASHAINPPQRQGEKRCAQHSRFTPRKKNKIISILNQNNF